MGKLSAKAIQNSRPGRLGDGGGSGLILVTSDTSRRWIVRFTRPGGRVTERVLGSFPSMPLQKAREAAFQFRQSIGTETEKKPSVTFASLSASVLEVRLASFKEGTGTAAQWRHFLSSWRSPLNDKDVASISVNDVAEMLKPLYQSKPATADRVRTCVEAVIDAAMVRGLRDKPNPARWKGNLALILPRRRTMTNGHHEALPYRDMPQLMQRLRGQGTVVSMALEFAILTASRKSEAMGLRRGDICDGIMTIPASRTKQGKEHRVPLSQAAMAILRQAQDEAQNTSHEFARRVSESGDLVFLSPTSQQLHRTAFNDLLKRMGVDATPHGICRLSSQ